MPIEPGRRDPEMVDTDLNPIATLEPLPAMLTIAQKEFNDQVLDIAFGRRSIS
ncbi:MAG: hypothetical protein KC777_30000 [Cyanobacteria bacterium HKST-UBA02]|nr:hypothetical protein [Cyanobacteria bacterium HKST-UBA02]